MVKTLVTLILLLASLAVGAAPVSVASARVWPGTDYTRITFETVKPVDHKMTVMKNPDRLVLDLENVDFNTALKSLVDKVQGSDPYIRKIRTAVFKPGTIRVVVELKQEARPSFFALKPAGSYKHRLVLDIYPKADPLMALLEQRDSVPADQPGGWTADALASQPAEDAAPEVAAPSAIAEPTTTVAITEETPAPAEETPVPKDDVERLITVAIDAGHGGEDSGARGANGSNEKDITLIIAKKLKGLIDAEPNMRGVLTRDGDYFIPLHGRVLKARKLQADLFVSVHADAFTRQDARGSSVFALSERGATSAMARLLAKHENESDLIGGVNIDTKDPYLARTLLDLSQTATISDSLKLGKAVLGHLGEINDLHKGTVEQAGFAVLKAPDIPSILVETAFISNPEEEKRLNDDEYQTRMANAILSGIKRYFASNPPLSKGKKVVFND